MRSQFLIIISYFHMVKIIQFINIQDLDNIDKIHLADNKSLLDKLIY